MAKRVNTRFLIVLTIFFGIAIAAGLTAHAVFFSKDPKAQVRAGDELMKEGKPKEAIERYRFALAKNPSDKEVLVRVGDAFNQMVADDPQNLYHARGYWNQAVANDPSFEPALQRLVDSYWEQMELMPLEGELYARVRETAERLSKVRPADVKVQARMHVAMIRPWLEGIPIKSSDLDNSVKSLTQLMPRDRANADIPYYIALVKLRRAQEQRQRDENGEAARLCGEASAVMDAAVKDQPANPAVQLRAFQVYSRLEQIEKAAAFREARRKAGGDDVAAAAVEQANPAAVPEGPSGAKARKALAAALEAAKALQPSDPLYADIQIEAAEAARAERKYADSEKIYEELVAKRPNDQNVRLRYAKALSTSVSKRDKAVEVLSRAVETGHLTGARGFEAANLKARTLVELANTRLEQVRAAGDNKARQDIIQQVRQDLEKLEAMMSADSVPVLRVRARLQQVEGDAIGSIQTYQRAVSLMEGSPNKDFNLINELANAYLYAGQTGSAKKLLEQIISRHDWYVPARLQMAQVLLTENKLDEAKVQLTAAERQLAKTPPDQPDYATWRLTFDRTALALLSRIKDPRFDEQLAKMPEKTRNERLAKASIAKAFRKYDEAVRLATLAVKENPKDLGAVELLVNCLLAADRKPDAIKAVDEAIAANADQTPQMIQRFKSVREQIVASVELANATPDQRYERRKQIVMEEADSPERTLKLADLETEFNHPDRAEALLVKMHEQFPGDVQPLVRLFDLTRNRREWDKAKGWLDKLVATKSDGADGLLYQFRFATSKGDRAEALRVARALVRARPEFDVSYVAYGQALQSSQRYAEAIQNYIQARARKPANFDALRGMVECYKALNQPELAKNLINEARGLFPENAMFRELELNHELTYGDPVSVASEWEQLQRDEPDKLENWVGLAASYRQAARAKFDNDPAKRSEYLKKSQDVLQKGLAKWAGDQQLVAMLADVMQDLGDVAGGEKLLADNAAANAAKSQPLLMLADYYIRANKFEQAEASSRAALAKAQAAGDAGAALDIRLRLSGFLAGLRRFDDALKLLDEAGPVAGPAAAAADRRLFGQRLDILIAADRRDLAEQALVDILAKPGNAEDTSLQLALVKVNFEGGKYDQALDRCNKVLRAEPDNVQARYMRGQILLRKPAPEINNAIAEFNEVRKVDPLNVGTRLLLADAYRAAGDTPRAIRELEDSLRTQPLSKELRLKLIELHSTPGSEDWADVLRLVREARTNAQLKDDPAWPYRESLAWTARRDFAKAVAAIEDAVKLAPRDMALRREHQEALLRAGRFEEVLAMTDPDVKAKSAPWWEFMNRAAAKQGMKDERGSAAEFDTALTAAGNENAAVEQIVKTMASVAGRERAIQQVLARSQKEPRWKLIAAALYSVDKDWNNTVKMLDEVQAHFDELTTYQKAQALRIAGPLYQLARPPQFDKARNAYLQLLQIEPNDLFALNNLASLLVEDSLVPQAQEARKYSEKAYDLVKRRQPFPAAVFDTHGWVLIQCDDVNQGIEILQRVVRQESMPEAHYHLGEGYLKKAEPKKALEEFKFAAQSITTAQERGYDVSPDLDKKIQSATERANEAIRVQKGGEAAAQ